MNRIKILLSATLFAAGLLAIRYSGLSSPVYNVPADLRDAVAEGGALEQLSGGQDQMAVPEPVAPQVDAPAEKSIYGSDDRVDYFDASADVRGLADSVVSLWDLSQVKSGNGGYELLTTDIRRLCPNEKFREQLAGAFCSGTLVGEDLVLTAGHCITDEAVCKRTAFVFDFKVDRKGDGVATTVKAQNIYGCKRVIARSWDKAPSAFFPAIVSKFKDRGPDYALVQLDRKAIGRKPLSINRGGAITKGVSVFAIGHPLGLPVKVTDNAIVRDTTPKSYFLTDLDAFTGNSGSAVFNARTKLIEGVMVRAGFKDFLDTGNCVYLARMEQNAGKGTAVTKISVIQDYIP